MSHSVVGTSRSPRRLDLLESIGNVFLWPGRDWLRKGFEAWFTTLIELAWREISPARATLNERGSTAASAVEPRPLGGPGVRHRALVGLAHMGGVFGEKTRLVAGRQRTPGGAAGGDFRVV